MSSIFGGSKSSSSSSNRSYDYLQNALGGTINSGVNAGTQIADMLGLNGASSQNSAFDTWKNSTGYQSGLTEGMNAVTGSAAAKGLLNSGATAKALTTFGNDYASRQYGSYMDQLNQLLGSGLAGAGTLAGAGQTSTSSSSGSNSKAGFLGSLLSK